MPLVKDQPIDPKPLITSPPTVASDSYKGIVADTKYDPVPILLTHLEGASLIVDYYSQVLGKDTTTAAQNVTRTEQYQQYKLIRNFEFRLTTDFTPSQDTTNMLMSISGSATLYPFLTPNKGDMFVADVGDGKLGVFSITGTERRSLYKETAYHVDFRIEEYLTEERKGDFARKTVETRYFRRDFLTFGQNPLLTKDDFEAVKELEDEYARIVIDYTKSFYSREYSTMLVPGQELTTYDHWITKALHSFFSASLTPEIRRTRVLNVDDDDCMRAMTLWDVLLQREPKMMDYVMQKVGLTYAKLFTREPMLEGIRYSGMEFVVYPKDHELSIDYQLINLSKALAVEGLKPVGGRFTSSDLASLLIFKEMAGFEEAAAQNLPWMSAPTIKPVLVDDHYIFSQAFYDKTAEQSLLEIITWWYLEDKAIDPRLLLRLTKTQYKWFGLERFYYTPILLILIGSVLRRY